LPTLFHTSEIKQAFGIFLGDAFDGMLVDHGGPDIAVPQQFLDRPNIIVGLQKVAGKTVTKGVSRGTLRDCSFRRQQRSCHQAFRPSSSADDPRIGPAMGKEQGACQFLLKSWITYIFELGQEKYLVKPFFLI